MATSFDRTQLQHVAQLASLTLNDHEVDALANDMQRILAYVDELETVDTSNVEPTTSVTLDGSADAGASRHRSPTEASALRVDELAPSLDRKEVLSQAPRATENGFLVPTFVES